MVLDDCQKITKVIGISPLGLMNEWINRCWDISAWTKKGDQLDQQCSGYVARVAKNIDFKHHWVFHDWWKKGVFPLSLMHLYFLKWCTVKGFLLFWTSVTFWTWQDAERLLALSSGCIALRNIFSPISDPPPIKWHYHAGWGGSSEGSRPVQPTGKLTVSEVTDKPPYWVIGQTNQISIPWWSPLKSPPMKN